MNTTSNHPSANTTLASLFLTILVGCTASQDTQAPSSGNTAAPAKAAASTCASISPAEFKKIASSPADDTPLFPELAAAGPLWRNATVTIALKYQDGKTFNEQVAETSKTVAGKYIVTTVFSKYYNQPMDSIMTYDQKTSSYKLWAIYGDIVTEGHIIYDLKNKLFAMDSAYGEGFTELGVGSFTDTESTSCTYVYKNGLLFCTRAAKTTPTTEPVK